MAKSIRSKVKKRFRTWMKARYDDVVNHKNTSSARGWSHLVPNVVGNCFPRKYGNDRKSGCDTSDGCSEEGIGVVKTTISESQQQRNDRKRAEDFLLFMDKAKAPQLAPSPLLSRSAVSTVAYSDEKYHQEKKKPCPGRGSKPPLCTSSHFQKGRGVPSLDVGEKHPVVVGPVTTICRDETDEIIGETLCVVPPFLKGHSVAIKITLNDYIPKADTRDSPLSFCVGLSTGPQLEQERGIVISFCSSRSEVKHMRPRKVCSNTANSQSTEVEAVVISESRVLFYKERHFWILWGEGLLFAGLGDNVGSRLLMAADTASPEYTFGYGAGATSVRERYSTDEVERIYVASRGPAGCAVEWQRVEILSSSW
ncbi:hypothetical protein Pmar_PMAR021908 [Perkinsus marinus ATCC 50983]|uniref:Uncharacterized protein n=1 Tax=Perkinsus marinus (strain ATCC 50983 / TXsc) TaxID=423536 RepID=C5LLF1_PERM5|nr:hypothetical protein Pmar_PMAR021908 [Perkinsus marinus ATCC 50983]EER02450.1 hypothetical protein Pmar_PMAR021908 [Perkinsus marinus ATCC 50983]|eukprot:XP_002769732.1 hypothetical protein Pmar_PMAR021908 [Perkinsus marinus ATCC 50983]